jgi:hypothetical protein
MAPLRSETVKLLSKLNDMSEMAGARAFAKLSVDEKEALCELVTDIDNSGADVGTLHGRSSRDSRGVVGL